MPGQAPAGIQKNRKKPLDSPRIKYGAGFVKPGMTVKQSLSLMIDFDFPLL
jgi:hypothetical protein